MFGKSRNWWLGKNSLFGQWVSGELGSGNGQIASVGHELNITDEQKLMIGALILLLVLKK